MRRALVCASLLCSACSADFARPPGGTVTRLDGTIIDTTSVTEQIEALTRAANAHGLTVTIFNDAQKVYSHAFGTATVSSTIPLSIRPKRSVCCC